MAKILIGVDFSPESERAARQALEVARHTGDELVLVHASGTVEMPPIDETSLSSRSLETYRQLIASSLEADRNKLAALRERLSGQGPVVSQVVVEGFPDAALCEVAKQAGAALIAVGTHGRTGLKWFFLGSVAQRVVREAETDVLVIRRDDPAKGGFHRVLVATDFTADAQHALDRALILAAPDAEIDVVHCHHVAVPVGLNGSAWPMPAEIDQELVDQLTEQGKKLIAGKGRAAQKLRFQVLREPAALGLVHWLETHPTDLIALGSHGRRGFRRAILGSVAETVVRRAPCSVLVGHRPQG